MDAVFPDPSATPISRNVYGHKLTSIQTDDRFHPAMRHRVLMRECTPKPLLTASGCHLWFTSSFLSIRVVNTEGWKQSRYPRWYSMEQWQQKEPTYESQTGPCQPPHLSTCPNVRYRSTRTDWPRHVPSRSPAEPSRSRELMQKTEGSQLLWFSPFVP